MYLALGLGILAGLIALVAACDLFGRLLSTATLTIWRAVADVIIASITATIAIWLLTLTLPMALA